MTTATDAVGTTGIELRRRRLASGEARAAVFTRRYDADVADVWDACTDPARLARWYAPVEGDLRLGGRFTQGDFGPGRVLECEPPYVLRVGLGGADPSTDEITLRLTEGEDGTTVLEFEHATTLDAHDMGGQVFDAVYCMGGGYGPRLVTLEQHLNGTLPVDLDATQLHMREDYRSPIQDSMAALDVLVTADKASPVPVTD